MWSPLSKLGKKRKAGFEDHSTGALLALAAPAAGDGLQCAAEKGRAATADATADITRTTPAPAREGDNERDMCVEDDPDQDVPPKGDAAPLLAGSRDDDAVAPAGGSLEGEGGKGDEWKDGVKGETVGEDELRRPLLQSSRGPAWD